jgi:hypothetical protein
MLKRLHGLPDNVLGIEASGKVTEDDYQRVLVPAIRELRDHQAKIRLIYVLGEEFDGWSMGAIWEDAKLGLKDSRAWEKIAIVTDKDWVENAIRAFGWMVPGEVRVFEVDEYDDAREWAAD